MSAFCSADLLLPKVDIEKWAVIACDQFTSQPEYWERVRLYTKESISTFHLILPEAELSEDRSTRIANIHKCMEKYCESDVFDVYLDAYVYVERTLLNGKVRSGVVGVVDLENYDMVPGAQTAVRATERTVLERIPPRMEIRRNAGMEFSHVILLCDDERRELIENLSRAKEQLQKLYDFDLMEGGGHIRGWLLEGEQKAVFEDRLCRYEGAMREKCKGTSENPLLFVVGDGNHSLATAKACYEEAKKTGCDVAQKRYALVELENLHSDSQEFEPIHRVVTGVRVEHLLDELKKRYGMKNGHTIEWYSGDELGEVTVDAAVHRLAVGVLQKFLDEYIEEFGGKIDYIHEKEMAIYLAREESAIAFLLPPIEKAMLFQNIMNSGVLPRKTFSVGHATEKRYYIEGRKI